MGAYSSGTATAKADNTPCAGGCTVHYILLVQVVANLDLVTSRIPMVSHAVRPSASRSPKEEVYMCDSIEQPSDMFDTLSGNPVHDLHDYRVRYKMVLYSSPPRFHPTAFKRLFRSMWSAKKPWNPIMTGDSPPCALDICPSSFRLTFACPPPLPHTHRILPINRDSKPYMPDSAIDVDVAESADAADEAFEMCDTALQVSIQTKQSVLLSRSDDDSLRTEIETALVEVRQFWETTQRGFSDALDDEFGPNPIQGSSVAHFQGGQDRADFLNQLRKTAEIVHLRIPFTRICSSWTQGSRGRSRRQRRDGTNTSAAILDDSRDLLENEDNESKDALRRAEAYRRMALNGLESLRDIADGADYWSE